MNAVRMKAMTEKAGDRQEVMQFLWLPKTLNGVTRWLQNASVVREAYVGWHTPPDMSAWRGIKWRDIAWGACGKELQ